jgi:hypothetical protein
MKKITWLLLILFTLTLASCASAPIGALIPADTRAKIAGSCDAVDEFAAVYPARRAEVIANREWIAELMPNVWAALQAFDRHAGEIYTVVTLVCDLVSGSPTAQAELDAKRVEYERRGINWAPLLDNATKVAVMLLESQLGGKR